MHSYSLPPYEGLTAYYGDLHNHCGISYGHGSLEEAFRNAREQLDFCSVTGHALWPDMPEPDEAIQYIVDFHEAGFARLRERWPEVQRVTEAYHRDGEFVTFLSFEMHSCADGDYTVLYDGARGDILEVDGLADLRARLRDLRRRGVSAIAFPHHIAYRRGQRGVNWATFDEAFSPVVEIISMHGCSEADEGTRPFLHVMGPSDHESTMQYGLSLGHCFGVIGSTDHHSAHPGSYGHGRTGLWARAKTRPAIWEALRARRTYALTGDRIELQFAVNGHPMGARIAPAARHQNGAFEGVAARHQNGASVGVAARRQIAFRVLGGAPIDCVDVVKNGQLLRRFSRCDVEETRFFPKNLVSVGDSNLLRTKLYLEVGWGERGVRADWEVQFGISDGRILAVEPRFRGPEVVAPTDLADCSSPATEGEPHLRERAPVSHWEPDGSLGVRFRTVTFGNPNNATPATQGLCLDVEMPPGAEVRSVINGRRVDVPLAWLLEGARAGRLGKIASPAYRFHRAPRRWEFDWEGAFEDVAPSEWRLCRSGGAQEAGSADVYYLRVRQVNDQWAWSSPIWVAARCEPGESNHVVRAPD